MTQPDPQNSGPFTAPVPMNAPGYAESAQVPQVPAPSPAMPAPSSAMPAPSPAMPAPTPVAPQQPQTAPSPNSAHLNSPTRRPHRRWRHAMSPAPAHWFLLFWACSSSAFSARFRRGHGALLRSRTLARRPFPKVPIRRPSWPVLWASQAQSFTLAW